jgi:hypothetical protein
VHRPCRAQPAGLAAHQEANREYRIAAIDGAGSVDERTRRGLKAMNWSNAYFELGAGTLLAVIGVTFLVLIRRKAAHTEQLDVRFFFYFAAVFFGFAAARAMPSPWSFLGVAAALIALVPVIRALRAARAAARSHKVL